MKLHLAILLAVFFTTVMYSSVSGQKCSFEKNEIDGITELPVKITEPQMLMRINGQPLYAKAQSIGENKYVKLIFYKYNDFSFQEQREIGFVLSNNQEVTLYPRVMPVDSTMLDAIEYKSLLIYKLTSEQYEMLVQTPAVKFKYYLISGFVEENIKTSKQQTLSSLLRCVE